MPKRHLDSTEMRTTKLFDSAIVGNAQEAVDFITNILESSAEYSIIGQDLDGKILLWNEGARGLYGYEPEEIIGKANSAILYTSEDVQAGKPREILETTLRNGKWEGTLNRVRKNGQHFTARMVITPRHDVTGRANGFLVISKDISEEIRYSTERNRAEEKFRRLLESAPDAIIIVNQAGQIMLVSSQTEKLFGYSREELLGQSIETWCPHASATFIRTTVPTTLSNSGCGRWGLASICTVCTRMATSSRWRSASAPWKPRRESWSRAPSGTLPIASGQRRSSGGYWKPRRTLW